MILTENTENKGFYREDFSSIFNLKKKLRLFNIIVSRLSFILLLLLPLTFYIEILKNSATK